MTTLQLNGEWTDRYGKIWRSSQSGNTFNWVENTTGRVASDLYKLFRFDGTKHLKYSSNNGNQLISSVDTFTKAPSNSFPTDFNQSIIKNVPLLTGAMYQDYCGMIWNCSNHEGGHFVLSNLTDGRSCDGYVVFDIYRNVFIIYIVFVRNGVENVFKSEATNLNEMDLSNGDYFRRVGGNTPLPQPVDPPLLPTTTQQLPQPTPIQMPPQPTTRYYRIGGGKDGVSTWTKWNGLPCLTVVEGWEVVFEVDQNGNISGSNRTDYKNTMLTKYYSGTFKNNVFDISAKFSDGRVISYKGSLTGNKVRVDYVILTPGNLQGGTIGDGGFNVGTLFETSAPPCQPKTYTINGKTYWKRYNALPSSSIVDGWMMSFNVDKYGNISGSNKNAGQAFTKTYSGTLINNLMDATAKWDDGRTATYKGSITNNTIKLDFIITAPGTQPGQSGDSGFNTGIVTSN
ncbi:predicted protein [Naegleria gruberi]|uniref:Predicted protein n=1 Tax=Naegleria gruberi TaxID=5762 RepID=D2VN66_NAEGR|nr:uncharacterized protein NAEGRDRAFT_70387 [Naegleria gruberi]EFC41597.1 predicted protein [Naegleria gruberi]|eukprot:XP_002674341.1 predicted protein [Naegleria gruberi strain NEG-M]